MYINKYAIISQMNTADTISSILAGLTFLGIIVALGLGLWSMLGTRSIQKAQYREKFIDNILDWLYSYEGCASRYNIQNLSEDKLVREDAASAAMHYSIITGNRANDFRHLRSRGLIIATYFKDKEGLLPKTISKLNSKLEILADINYKYRISFMELPVPPTDFPKVTALLESYRDEHTKVNKDINKLTDTIVKETIKLSYTKSFL